MYVEFYHLNTDPFCNAPFEGHLFASHHLRNAWRYLRRGQSLSDPIMLVTGEYGAGKTTLALKYVQFLQTSPENVVIPLLRPTYRYCGILKRIARELGFDADSAGGGDDAIQEAFFERLSARNTSKTIHLIVDEASELSISTLGKLRYLTDFSDAGVSPFRLILFAHTSFLRQLRLPPLQALAQRIRRAYNVERLYPNETKEYIYFRLVRAGAHGIPDFTPGAFEMIHGYSKGIPRMIHNICGSCLVLGQERGVNTIDEKIVAEAVKFVVGRHRRDYGESRPEGENAENSSEGKENRETAAPGQSPEAPPTPPLSTLLHTPPPNPEADLSPIDLAARLSSLGEMFEDSGKKEKGTRPTLLILCLVLAALVVFLACQIDYPALLKSISDWAAGGVLIR
jgi:type II secretory pathway predicted ATPase ExeA